ncbi:interferon-inducible double-stranded RNA-dependent protein kinase activator A, partial [Aphis craccivora]
MAEISELNSDSGLISSVDRLREIMAGKEIIYKILSVVKHNTYEVYTINAVCEEYVSNGCGLSEYEAQNDAATKMLNNLELTSTNQQCVDSQVKLSQYMNYIGSLQELCQARAWDFPKYEYSQGIKGLSKNQKHYYTVKCTAGPY